MYIKKTKTYEPYGDIIVSDGKNEIICFDGLGIDYRDKEIKNLTAVGANNIFRVEEKVNKVTKNDSYYGYNIIGQLISENFIETEGFEIEIDEYLPKDLKIGEYISFDTPKIIVEWIE